MDRTENQPIVCAWCATAGHASAQCEERREHEREVQRKAREAKPIRHRRIRPLAA